MGYKLSKRSLSRLDGVDEKMVAVVKYAIGVTKQDFSVICGLRTIEEQKALVWQEITSRGEIPRDLLSELLDHTVPKLYAVLNLDAVEVHVAVEAHVFVEGKVAALASSAFASS